MTKISIMTLDEILTFAAAEYVQLPNTKGQVEWVVRGRAIYLTDHANGWERRYDPSPVGGGHIGRYDVTALPDGRIELTWRDDYSPPVVAIVDRTVEAVLAQLDDIQLRDQD